MALLWRFLGCCWLVLATSGCTSPRSGLLDGLGDASGETAWAPEWPGVAPEEAVAALLLAGAEGSAEAAAEAGRRAEELARERPSPRADALAGAARLLSARFAENPFRKLSDARAGLALLDGAIASDPTDWGNRYLRATSSFPLPDFLGRRAQALADLSWLAENCSVIDPFATPRRRALVLLQLGVLRREDGDSEEAIRLFSAAVAMAPDSAPGRRARLELEGPSETDR